MHGASALICLRYTMEHMLHVPDDSRLCTLGERPKSGAEQQPSGRTQVWFPTDRNMAGCDNCSFWVHDHCDEAAGTAIEFGDAVTYYCPPCRHQADAHHKLQVTPACLPAKTMLACAIVEH